jgi:LytR cell envelope-related transcriptional attenuator
MRVRNERGVVFPSPVVMLSVVAVAMAGVAYVATRSDPPAEREVTTVAQSEQEQPSESAPAHQRLPQGKAPTIKKAEPVVERGKVYVEVYNNSGITGLAGSTAAQASGAGWQVVGSDNWYGTIPASTVYYPERLKAAAKVLALDLGIGRVMPAIEPMDLDRLTVILTADAA